MGLGLGMKIDDQGNAVPGNPSGTSQGYSLPSSGYGNDPNF
jgi:hypothetical protein